MAVTTRVIRVREGSGTYTLPLQIAAGVCLIIAAGCTGSGAGVYFCHRKIDDCPRQEPFKNWPIDKWYDIGRFYEQALPQGNVNRAKFAGQYFAFCAELFCILLVVGLLVYRSVAAHRNLFMERGWIIAMIVIAVVCGILEAWYGAPTGAFEPYKIDAWIAASFFCFLGAVFYLVDLVVNRSL